MGSYYNLNWIASVDAPEHDSFLLRMADRAIGKSNLTNYMKTIAGRVAANAVKEGAGSMNDIYSAWTHFGFNGKEI